MVASHIFKKIFKILLFIVSAFLFLLIVSGYIYTFFKEHIHTYTTPTTIQRTANLGSEISYIAYGNPSNQAIVFLHGTGANAFIWEKTSTYLVENGYYVIAVDLPPFGWSTIPNDQDYKKEIQSKKVGDLLKALSIADPIIVGHSYNSKVALLLASDIPTKKLILVAPVLDYEPKQASTSLISTLASITMLRDPLLSLFINNTFLADKILLSFMYKKDVDISSVLPMTVLPFNKPGVNHAYGEWFEEFFNETSTISDYIILKDLKTPVFVLWGDKDTIAPIENFTKVHALYNNSSLTTLPDVGHMPHLENSGLFNSFLLQIIRK